MEKIVAYCGIPCSECPAFIATKSDDDEARAKVAKDWSKEFESNIKPEDINCDGCLTDGDRVFNHCNVCEIRQCARGKQIENCAYCDEYACEKLNSFFEMVPNIKQILDEIRENL